MDPTVIVSEIKNESLLEEFVSLVGKEAVVLDRLQEEPRSISRVEPSVVAAIMQVGQQAVSVDFGEEEDDVSCFLVKAWRDQKSSQGNKGVTAPASHEAGREMRQTSAHCVFVAGEED